MATATGIVLDPTAKSTEGRTLEANLKARVVGQDESVRAILSAYQIFLAGMKPPGRPAASFLFLGPTGSGKTRVVEATAEALFGDVRALLKIDCGEFQHSHEIAKLLGSPPGYLGHRETHPILTQQTLDQWHRPGLGLSLLLFDEIEKASDALWRLLLGVLDSARLTLGDNRRVDFSHSMIFMTSNLGAAEAVSLLAGKIGFQSDRAAWNEQAEEKIRKSAVQAARRKFFPEFLNRIDKIVSFRPLMRSDLELVLEIELEQLRQRLAPGGRHSRLHIYCSDEAKRFLIQDGLDVRYGARHLRRSIERHLLDPLANLVATRQINPGDALWVDCKSAAAGLTFIKSVVSRRPSSRAPRSAATA